MQDRLNKLSQESLQVVAEKEEKVREAQNALNHAVIQQNNTFNEIEAEIALIKGSSWKQSLEDVEKKLQETNETD